MSVFAPSQKAYLVERKLAEHTQPGRGSSSVVLLAEDDDANSMVASVLLQMCGYEVERATNGVEAVEKATTGNYAFAVMDMRMQGMDGLEAARQIRKYEEQNGCDPLRIICVTASALFGTRERCLAAGMNDYLAKPYEPEEFKKKVLALTDCVPVA